jgi:hypothetical protein
VIRLDAGTYTMLVISDTDSQDRTYIVDAGSLSVHTNNQFCPLSLLLAIAQAIDLSRNDPTLSMIQGSRKSRQHKRLVYSVLGSHGDYGNAMLSYTEGSKKYNSVSRIFRPAIFLRRSISRSFTKKKVRADRNKFRWWGEKTQPKVGSTDRRACLPLESLTYLAQLRHG